MVFLHIWIPLCTAREFGFAPDKFHFWASVLLRWSLRRMLRTSFSVASSRISSRKSVVSQTFLARVWSLSLRLLFPKNRLLRCWKPRNTPCQNISSTFYRELYIFRSSDVRTMQGVPLLIPLIFVTVGFSGCFVILHYVNLRSPDRLVGSYVWSNFGARSPK